MKLILVAVLFVSVLQIGQLPGPPLDEVTQERLAQELYSTARARVQDCQWAEFYHCVGCHI